MLSTGQLLKAFFVSKTEPEGGGGYSLYSDDRDDRRIF